MKENCKISVIVPVYNAKDRLKLCVESILNQTMSDFEVWLIDDGSTDGSFEICDDLAKKDNRINVIHQENGGVSVARNKGIENSNGKYITFIDCDDTVDSDFLSFAFNTIENSNTDVFISGISMETQKDNQIETMIFTAKQEKHYTVKSLFEDLILNYPQICIASPCCKLYNRKLIIDNNINFKENLHCGEDTYFNLHVFETNPTVLMSDKHFYHYYRGNTDSLFSKFKKDNYENICLVYDYMRKVIINSECNCDTIDRFERMYIDYILGAVTHYFDFKNQTTVKQRYDHIKKVFSNEFLLKANAKSYKKLYKTLLSLGQKKHYWFVYFIISVYYNKNLRKIQNRFLKGGKKK